jgi:hypothetical protein
VGDSEVEGSAVVEGRKPGTMADVILAPHTSRS